MKWCQADFNSGLRASLFLLVEALATVGLIAASLTSW